MVIHSCTKYLAGHSDILAGCVVFKKQEHFNKLESHRIGFCAPLDPANCSLLLRSLRTLSIRIQRHNENAQAVAEFLEGHSKVKRVFYPGLKSHPQHELAKKQMKVSFISISTRRVTVVMSINLRFRVKILGYKCEQDKILSFLP